MNNILALDTSGVTASLSILKKDCDESECFYSISFKERNNILIEINTLLNQANLHMKEINLICFNCGPGHFSGLRLSSGIVQAVNFALGIPIRSISNLSIFAYKVLNTNNEIAVVLVYAGLQESYLAIFSLDSLTSLKVIHEPILINVNDAVFWISRLLTTLFSDDNKRIICVGNGWEQLKDSIPDNWVYSDVIYSQAQDLARFCLKLVKINVQPNYNNIIFSNSLLPFYVRNRVAFTSSEQEHGFFGNPTIPRKK